MISAVGKHLHPSFWHISGLQNTILSPCSAAIRFKPHTRSLGEYGTWQTRRLWEEKVQMNTNRTNNSYSTLNDGTRRAVLVEIKTGAACAKMGKKSTTSKPNLNIFVNATAPART